MLNLLKFEFRRILKSVFFRIVAGYCVVWPLLVALFYRIIFNISLNDSGLKISDFEMADDELRFLTWMLAVAFINELPKFIALFACIHIGSDYSNGMMRNKIIAGHSRNSLYFSYMLTQIASTVAWCILYICSALLGLLVFGIGIDLNGGEMFARFGVAIVVTLVITVISVVLSLSFRKRAVPIIFAIVLVMVMSTATMVIGNFNLPSKAVKDYIEIRHERYEDMIDEGILTEDTVEELEETFDRDYYLNLPWKICHPAYLISNLGFNGDYSTDTASMLFGSPEYTDEIDFSGTFASDSYSIDLFGGAPSGGFDLSGITKRDLRHVDSMHLTYTELNLIYLGKSMAWILFVGGWGYLVFRKKNLF